MKFKTNYVLFGLLFAVLAVFLLAQMIGKKTTETGDYVFPSLNAKDDPVKAKDIQAVRIKLNQPSEHELVFKRAESGWRLQDPNVRANGREVDQVVEGLMKATIDAKAELPSNATKAGLEPPRAVVTLVGKEGKEWTLNLGGGFEARVYVSSSDQPKEILAVSRSDLNSLFKTEDRNTGADLDLKDVNDYRSRDLIPQQGFDFEQVSLEGKPGTVILKRLGNPLDRSWVFEKPPYGAVDYEGSLIGM